MDRVWVQVKKEGFTAIHSFHSQFLNTTVNPNVLSLQFIDSSQNLMFYFVKLFVATCRYAHSDHHHANLTEKRPRIKALIEEKLAVQHSRPFEGFMVL